MAEEVCLLKCVLIMLSVVYIPVGVSSESGYNSSVTMSPAVSFEKTWEKDPLLPKDTIPYAYDILLHPDIENGTFTGLVSIKVNVTQPRNTLIIHAHELEITKSELFNENGSPIDIEYASSYAPNQFWIIFLKENLIPGKYEIKLAFSGTLTGKLVGFYRSSYTNEDGEKRYIVSSKLEPTNARRAFPCFDEPAFKAEFTVHLIRPSGDNYFALSNMNQVKEEADSPSAGLTKVSFAPTPPMSTYLAAFIVCDFEHLDPVYTSQGTPITVYARPGSKNKTQFALRIAKKSMDYFIDYFKIEYPLPKIDLIGIPDFVSGAMENWGLITFREIRILISPEASVADRQAAALTISHELAHMWFGDLVTMFWWDDLWLNEGFATYMSHKIVDKIEDDLFSEINFVVSHVQPVLDDDAAEASHPIVMPVNHPDQITEIFDIISYIKGASVIRMFESFQPENFQKSINSYLKKYKFSNALTENLWSELSGAFSLENTVRMLNTWTKQKGFPLVTVRKDGPQKLVLEQRKCLKDSSGQYDPDSSPYNYKWDIPITYITSEKSNSSQQVVFPSDVNEITIDLEPGTKWIKLNSRQQGFFRVNYPEEHWLSFKPLLESQEVADPLDRANLLEDAFSLARAGYLDYRVPFSLATYLGAGSERSYAPWAVLSKQLKYYKNLLYGTPAYSKLMGLGANLLKNLPKNDLWEVDDALPNGEKLLRAAVLSLSCSLEVPEVLARANEIFIKWIDGKSEKPNPSVRSLIYKFGVRGSNEAEYRKKLWNLYVNESDPVERLNYMAAIASVTNQQMIEELLELIKDENNVRSQDYFIFLFYICLTPEGGEQVWDFMRKNWDYLVKRFTLNDRTFGVLMPKVTVYFSTEDKLKEVEEFIKENPEAGAGAAGRRKALEKIKNNIKWKEQYYQNIEKALGAL